ncbi:hypothetical protein CVT26_012291 [Gymnopilus dilepis]|uniref:Cytochrome c oxidase assembly factor 3 n=1 Tax=Gymnopilus dilepis TaxID=231916 RepID=A0A409YQC7_9AGAR|nr:hypothetical protein CVT26_012291 [Gymnopilus dilepis]
MSPGLKRAREPFRVKNALLGLALAAFAVGVWGYSISAVKQDVFDDVDEEAEALASTGTGTGLGVGVLAKTPPPATVGAEERPAVVVQGSTAEPELTSPSSKALVREGGEERVRGVLEEVRALERGGKGKGRGVLPRLVGGRWPRLLDPERKTLVWGAPPLDNLGKMSEGSGRS